MKPYGVECVYDNVVDLQRASSPSTRLPASAWLAGERLGSVAKENGMNAAAE
jgi:hypothetical protein